MRHSLLAVRSPLDLVLHHIAPLGLAAARGTALVVDLDPESPAYPGTLTVAGLLADGVRREHLRPATGGVAVLGHGGASVEEAWELVEALAGGWPAVVVRAPRRRVPAPTVEVFPTFPAAWEEHRPGPAMLQTVASLRRRDATHLPPLRPAQVRAMLEGRIGRRWRWVAAWRRAWEMPWE